MRDREHPHPDLLLRFLQGETSKTENRAVVRHLLSGCAACTVTIQKTWELPDWPPRRQDRPRPKAPARSAPRFQLIRGRRA